MTASADMDGDGDVGGGFGMKAFTYPEQFAAVGRITATVEGALGDGLTNVNPPAFVGAGEANAQVRIYANRGNGPEPGQVVVPARGAP